MFRIEMKPDTIQFWILIVMAIGLLMAISGALWGAAVWADARYMKAAKGDKLSWEVHVLYLTTVPEAKRAEIEKQREQYELDQDAKK